MDQPPQPDTHSDGEELSVEDKAFDLTVRKMKTKVFPSQLPKHVSEMSRFVDHYEGSTKPAVFAGDNSWKFKL